jgi:hypothetical protein
MTEKNAQLEAGLASDLNRELYTEIAMITLKERIDDLCKMHGSLRKAAKAVDVDFGYLSGLRSGDKTSPSLEVLEKLGLKRQVHYVLK